MKRSMNVNIFLKQFKLPNAEIVKLIVEGNPEAIGQEKLKGLLKILPEKEEVGCYILCVICRRELCHIVVQL